MSISIADALRQVELQPGRVYHCCVGRFQVEVRVAESAPLSIPTPLKSSDVMLDPWTDLPSPQAHTELIVAPAPPLLPDPPDLPEDESP